MSDDPIADRRQRALEAGWDTDDRQDGIATAIEVATQVKITHDIVLAFTDDPDLWPSVEGPLIAAFRAAGFEVVES